MVIQITTIGCDENGYCGGMIEPIDEFREQELIDELELEEEKNKS